MTEKRFKLAFENYDGWAILDTTGEYSDDEYYIDWLSGQKAVDVMNHFADENEQLKQRNKRFEEKIQRERNSFTKTHERWSKEAETKIKELSEENEQLKQLNIPFDEIKEIVSDSYGRIIAIYYKR